MPVSQQQNDEITYISGVTSAGLVAAQSFATWNDDTPATYGPASAAAKWGSPTAGTGAAVTVAFDAASHWTATEEAGFLVAMHLWSAVANIQFNVASNSAGAGLVITRGSDKGASEETTSYYRGTINSAQLGVLNSTRISIDTKVAGFGPIGGAFSVQGGYPWMTAEHEVGHALGLGHGGPYDVDGSSGSDDYASYGQYDTRAWSIMSYHDADGLEGFSPTTPMVLDVAAAQRLYGVATNSPLTGGGQVFGFHSNIGGDIGQLFDFTVNRSPVVTIWDGGANNTLDLSGFSTGSTVTLVDGTLSSVGGLSQNLGIASGTRIETFVGGSGSDAVQGNDFGDVIQGGGGSDQLTGGQGNDHLYGNLRASTQGSSDGNDTINGGGGSDYINGNAGDDVLSASGGDSRLYGGQGNDTIVVTSGNNHINGNLGDDSITAGSGNDTIMGGQGDDRIHLGSGNAVVSGDVGNDHIFFGTGYVLAGGGAGSNIYGIGDGDARIDRGGSLSGYIDEVTDFKIGQDLIYFGRGTPMVLHAANDASYNSVGDAQAAAQALLNSHQGGPEVAAMQVGNDTLLFWNDMFGGDQINSGVKLDGVNAADLGTGSFTANADLMR